MHFQGPWLLFFGFVIQKVRKQEEFNEYIDTLKYVKYTRLANQYKQKAKKEDHFDVDAFAGSKEAQGTHLIELIANKGNICYAMRNSFHCGTKSNFSFCISCVNRSRRIIFCLFSSMTFVK